VPDFPPTDDVCSALEVHVRRFFNGHDITTHTWTEGPILEANPHFRVLQIAPRAGKGLWIYVSIGGWATTEHEHHGLEFVMTFPAEAVRGIELLAQTVFYNRAGILGLGHSFPLGEPWLPGSLCDHILISLPHLWGPDLGKCHVGDRHVDFLWLLPITPEERAYKASAGREELESRFEEVGLEYIRADRKSVV
jgi:hypothetical protein